MSIETQKNELLDLVNAKNNSELTIAEVEMAVGAITDGKTALRLTPAAESKYYAEDDVFYSKLDLEKYFHGITLVLDLKSDQLTAGQALKLIADRYGLDLIDADIKDPDAEIGIGWNFPILEHVQVNATDESYRWSGHVEFTARYFWRAIDRIITERKLDGLTYLETSDGSLTSLQLTSYPLEFKTAAVQLSTLKTGDTISQAIAAAVNSDYNTAYGTQFDTDGAILGAAKVVNAGTAAELGFTGKDGLNVVIAESVKDAVNKFAGQIHIFFTKGSHDGRLVLADYFKVDKLVTDNLSQLNNYYSDFVLQYVSMFAKGNYFFGQQDFNGNQTMPIGIDVDWDKDEDAINKIFEETTIEGTIVDGRPTITIAAKADSATFQGSIVVQYPMIPNNAPMCYSDGSLEPAHLLELMHTTTGNADQDYVGLSFAVNILMSCPIQSAPVVGAVLGEVDLEKGVIIRMDAVWDAETKNLTTPEAVALFGDGTCVFAETAMPWTANNNHPNAQVKGATDADYSSYALNPLYAALAPFAARYVKNDEEIRHGGYSYPVYPENMFYAYNQSLLDLINLGAVAPSTLEAFDYWVKKGRMSQGWLSAPFINLTSTTDQLRFEIAFGRSSTYWSPVNLGTTQGYLNFVGMANTTLNIAKGLIPDDLAEFDFQTLVDGMGWMKAMAVACAICDYNSEGIIKINDAVQVETTNGLRTFTVANDGPYESEANRRGWVVAEVNMNKAMAAMWATSTMYSAADFLANAMVAGVTGTPWQLALGLLAHPDADDNIRKMALKSLIPVFNLGNRRNLTDWTVVGNVSMYMDIVGAIDAGEISVTAATETDAFTGNSHEMTKVSLKFPSSNRAYRGSIDFSFPTPTSGKQYTFSSGFSSSGVSGLDILKVTTNIGQPDFDAVGTWGAQVLNVYQYIDRRAVSITGTDVTIVDAAAFPGVTWGTDGTSGFNGTTSPQLTFDLSSVLVEPKIHGLLAVPGENANDRLAAWAYAMKYYLANTSESADTRSIKWTLQSMFAKQGTHSLNSAGSSITVVASVNDSMGYTSTVTVDITGANTNSREIAIDWDTMRSKANDQSAYDFFREGANHDYIDWFDLFSGFGADTPAIFNLVFEASASSEYGIKFSETLVPVNDGDDVLVTNTGSGHWPITLRISNSEYDPTRMTFTPTSKVDATLTKSQVFDGDDYRNAMGYFMTPAADEAGELTTVLKAWAAYGATMDQSTVEAQTVNWISSHRDLYTFIVDRKVTDANSMATTVTVDLHCNELDVTLTMVVSGLDTTTNGQTLSWNAVRTRAPGKTTQAFFADSATTADSVLTVFAGYLNPETYSTLFVAEGTEYKLSTTIVVGGGGSLAQITNSAAVNPAVDGDVAPVPQMFQVTNANQS